MGDWPSAVSGRSDLLNVLYKKKKRRVVLDHCPRAASYALTPPQVDRAVRLTLKSRIGVKDPADADFDEDDSLVTLPDVTLLSLRLP